MEGQGKSSPGRSFGRRQSKSPAERSAEFDDIQAKLKQEAADRREASQGGGSGKADGEGSKPAGD